MAATLDTSAATLAAEPAWRGSALHDALPLVLSLPLLLAWDHAGLDLRIVELFGTAHGFPWRDHWLTAGLMHEGVRWLASGVWFVLLLGLRWPLPFARGLSRQERLAWWLATTVVLATVPLLKLSSATSCPWSLAEFGGTTARYVPHWMIGLRDGGSGRCFPSAHAATAFGFVTGWFALRRSAPRAARTWLAGTVLLGVAISAVQIMRGAHYPSHCLWAAWICWATAAACSAVARRWAEPAAPGATT